MNGGKPVFVPLRPPQDAAERNISSHEWKLDIEELKSKITPKTKMIVLNTPHNPIGKVFDESELLSIGRVAKEHNLIILSDEVVSILTLYILFRLTRVISTIVFSIPHLQSSPVLPIWKTSGNVQSLWDLGVSPLLQLDGVSGGLSALNILSNTVLPLKPVLSFVSIRLVKKPLQPALRMPARTTSLVSKLMPI